MAKEIEVKVPDIGSAGHVDVIEILVQVGDKINKETPLVTLESDKASMEIPSPTAGQVTKINLKVGDKVSEGDAILLATVEGDDEVGQVDSPTQSKKIEPSEEQIAASTPIEDVGQSQATDMQENQIGDRASITHIQQSDALISNQAPKQAMETVSEERISSNQISAGPAVRRMARELGVSLALINGSGRKTRITKEDVQAFVKSKLSEQSIGGNFNVQPSPVIDFSKFGAIDTQPLNKIKKLTGVNVHRSWITIPHVTQFDEADITDLEAFRLSESEQSKDKGYKLTLLAFVCSVVCKALRVYPQFNSSLDAKGENLIYKKYYNIGIAVETSNGLVVPVIKDIDQLTVIDIAKEMARLSNKARDKGLMPADMSGGCFTISSLGGIGGTAFTPIVNSPEVAILGLSRSSIKPIYIKEQFIPRLMLPLSLSYDHRVIDGAEAARFTRFIADALSDIRRILL